MLQDMKAYSPVGQGFVWVGEYSDGTLLSEFDPMTRQENSFYSIRKNDLIRFGLVGYGMKLYHETYGGHFKLNGQMYDFIYETDKERYPLTGQNVMYRDIITYKDADTVFSGIQSVGQGIVVDFNKTSGSYIVQYNFGYKVNLGIKGVKFYFKPIFHIPNRSPAFFTLWVVSDRDMDGRIVIKKNGVKVVEQEAPLIKDIGGEFKWEAR